MCTLVQAPTEVTDVESPMEMGLQVVVSHLMWVLGAKLWSSAKAVHALTAKQSLQRFW